MPVIIHWVELQKSKENSSKISTAVGILNIYQVDNVITKTEWNADQSAQLPFYVKNQYKQIQDYLNNPATCSLMVSLEKQGTNFRNKVWAEICKIPVGQVLSYSELAKKVDSGARAVANACRDNPFPGIIPCHRVVAVSGLGGYAGETSGKLLEIKKKLLLIEST
jgi:methylated-DNA-[protein]-cysteine S-methyltransferase